MLSSKSYSMFSYIPFSELTFWFSWRRISSTALLTIPLFSCCLLNLIHVSVSCLQYYNQSIPGPCIHLMNDRGHVWDGVQPKMSTTISFSGMYQKSFIYCSNRNIFNKHLEFIYWSDRSSRTSVYSQVSVLYDKF